MRGDGIAPMLQGEASLIDIHYQIKSEDDWFGGDLEVAAKVKESKSKLAEAIEQYFDTLHVVRYHKAPENKGDGLYNVYHYPNLIKDHKITHGQEFQKEKPTIKLWD